MRSLLLLSRVSACRLRLVLLLLASSRSQFVDNVVVMVTVLDCEDRQMRSRVVVGVGHAVVVVVLVVRAFPAFFLWSKRHHVARF